jgi:hypothetical protein
MTEPVRLIKHEAVPKCRSFEVRFSDGTHRAISIGTTYRAAVDSQKALERAKAVARAVRDKLYSQ